KRLEHEQNKGNQQTGKQGLQQRSGVAGDAGWVGLAKKGKHVRMIVVRHRAFLKFLLYRLFSLGFLIPVFPLSQQKNDSANKRGFDCKLNRFKFYLKQIRVQHKTHRSKYYSYF